MHNAQDVAYLTPYRRDVTILIKAEIKRLWDRARQTRGLTQAQLAEALNTSQSAVSKLLKPDDTHPWTINYIQIFCSFCQVDLKKDLLDRLPPGLAPFFDGLEISRPQVDDTFYGECASAVTKYFVDRGKLPVSTKMSDIARQVSTRTKRHATLDEINRTIEDVILDMVLGSE